MITVTSKSPFTGKYNSIRLDIPNEEFYSWCDKPRGFRPPIQDAFPQLSADEREFIISGVAPGEWDTFMGSDDDEWVQMMNDDESLDDWTDDDLEG